MRMKMSGPCVYLQRWLVKMERECALVVGRRFTTDGGSVNTCKHGTLERIMGKHKNKNGWL